jgi:hypothetical protein
MLDAATYTNLVDILMQSNEGSGVVFSVELESRGFFLWNPFHISVMRT